MEAANTIPHLILGYLVLMGMSLVIAVVIHLGQRTKTTKLNMAYWVSCILGFAAQGWANQDPRGAALALLPTIGLAYIILFFFQEVFDQRFPIARFSRFSLAGIMIGSGALVADVSFVWRALPFVLAITVPLALAMWQVIRSNYAMTAAGRALVVVVALWCLHMLDYPWLRLAPGLETPGFVAAFFFGFVMAILMPAVLVEKAQIGFQGKLRAEIEVATRDISAARDKLDIANEDKANLLRILSHDIRNSLAVSAYFFQRYDKVSTALKLSPSLEAWEQLDQAVKKSRNVHKNLLAFIGAVQSAQASSDGKVAVLGSTASISKCIDTARLIFEHRLQEKGIMLAANSDGHDLVVGDENLLVNHVFSNLVSNAIKFSDPGSTITISSRDRGSFVEVAIQDQGIGIPAEILPRLFDFKAKTSRSGTQGESGTGYGMPIVHQTLRLCGASIEVISTPRSASPGTSGTTFVLAFQKPAAQAGESSISGI